MRRGGGRGGGGGKNNRNEKEEEGKTIEMRRRRRRRRRRRENNGIKMDVLITYHGMARGSPYVFPSWDKISTPPQVNNLRGLLYVLMIYMEISG